MKFGAAFGLSLLIVATSACSSGGGSGSLADESSLGSEKGASKTAQGLMVDFGDIDNVAIVTNELYKLDQEEAASYYYNGITGTVIVNCSGNAASCASTNWPTPPDAPAPDDAKLDNLAWQDRCVFLDGGTLGSEQYTKSISMKGKNGSGNYTFVFTYLISASAPVAPNTAWELFHTSTEGDAVSSMPLDIKIAGQSVNKSSNAKLGTKYSYSLLNPDGTSRVQNLQVSFNGVLLAEPSSTVAQNCPGCLAGDAGAVDFWFEANAGTNGDSSLLLVGDARSILNSDTFAGNNNGGADGSALAHAIVDSIELPITDGDNLITVSGTVKGVDALASQTFTSSKTVHVVHAGCSNAP
jgi:hypothetical protein